MQIVSPASPTDRSSRRLGTRIVSSISLTVRTNFSILFRMLALLNSGSSCRAILRKLLQRKSRLSSCDAMRISALAGSLPRSFACWQIRDGKLCAIEKSRCRFSFAENRPMKGITERHARHATPCTPCTPCDALFPSPSHYFFSSSVIPFSFRPRSGII